MAQTFYQPLRGLRSIRLLRIATLPPHVSPGLPRLSCFLQTFELDHSPEYNALSYTWGEAVCEDKDISGNCQPSLPIFLTRLEDEYDEHLSDGQGDGNDLEKQRRIIGSPYLITQNLQDALEQLFISDYAERWLWIDALCINQDDTDEKGVQVALMGEIYSSAKEVIVWLGADESDLDDFLWLHTVFIQGLHIYIAEFGAEDLMLQSPYSPTFLRRMDISPPCGDWLGCWTKYLKFCRSRRWFSRIWVVQEVTLNAKVVVKCGKSTISWDGINLLSNIIVKLRWQIALAPADNEVLGRALADETIRFSIVSSRLQLGLTNEHYGSLLTSLENISLTGDVVAVAGQRQARSWYILFQMLLFETRTYSATDPRDKIYAILGMAKTSLPVGMAIPLTVDYSMGTDAQTLYTSTASLFIAELPRLLNLSLVEDKACRCLNNLPSWVPDHTVTLTSTPLILLRGPNSQFNTCPSRILPSRQYLIREKCLMVEGAKFDRIVEVCLPMWEMIRTSNIESCLQACERLDRSYPSTGEDPGEVLWRTLIANTFEGVPAPSSLLSTFKIWARNRLASMLTPKILEIDESGVSISHVTLNEVDIERRLATLNRLHQRSNGNISLPTVREVLEAVRLLHRFQLQEFVARHATLDPGDPFPDRTEKLYRFGAGEVQMQTALGHTIPFRRIYRTEKGYLGLGPASVEIGDEVWLLQGAVVPFILRGIGDGTWSLMGESYLHGYMDGKMAEELKDNMAPVTIV